MTVARDTYVSRMLASVGLRTLPATSERRYPAVELTEDVLRAVDLVLFSTEPFPFKERHLAEFRSLHPAQAHKAATIDAQMVSWYGSRAVRGLAYLAEFARAHLIEPSPSGWHRKACPLRVQSRSPDRPPLATDRKEERGGLFMKVSKLLKLHGMLVLTVHPDFTLAEAARRFATSVGGRRFSLAVVTNHDDQVLGVISLGDISHVLGEHEGDAAKMLVRDVMTTDVTSCSLDDDLEDVLRTMADKGIRHTPVVEGGKLAGLVARRDALEFLYQQASLDAAHLTDWLFRSDARY